MDYKVFVLVVLFLSGFVLAWSENFTLHVANKVLIESYPLCESEIAEGVHEVYVNEDLDTELGEPVSLHCDLNCPAYDSNYCNFNSRSCVSSSEAGRVKTIAEKKCNCDQARYLAKAITYYLAKDDPMNRMIHETCKHDFEEAVDTKVFSGINNWKLDFQCDGPNRTFSFSSDDLNEILRGASSFAYANAFAGTKKWYCYTLSGSAHNDDEPVEIVKYENGELCNTNDECESNNCMNSVCCDMGHVCCPAPNIKGYPCAPGEYCSKNYYCLPISLDNGAECDSDDECISGNCRPGSKSLSTFHCCEVGNDFCCVNDSECLANEKCENYACVPMADDEYEKLGEDQTSESKNDNKESSICPLMFLPLTITILLYKF